MDRELDSEEMTDRELHGIVGGAGLMAAWNKIGPIVKPILYPARLARVGASLSGIDAMSSGSCAGGVCR